MADKRVLVEVGSNRRPVLFKPSNEREDLDGLKRAVLESFRDILSSADASNLLLQVKSEEWNGEFIDALDSDVIPDKSVIKVTVTTTEVICVAVLLLLCLFHLFFQAEYTK